MLFLAVVTCRQRGPCSGCVADLHFRLQLLVDPLPWVCVQGSQPLIQLRAHPGAFCLCSQAAGAYQGARPPGVSGVGPRPLIGVCTHWGTLGLAPRQPGRLSGRVLTPEFQLWAPSPLIWVPASRASGESRACYSAFTVQGLRG